MTNGHPPVLVIGAGVIGLTTAITLAEHGHPVIVATRDDPAHTTSAAAGALWGPWLVQPRDRVLRWAAHTLAVLRDLATDPATTGVRIAAGRDITTHDYPPPDWAGLLPDRRPCRPDELPPGYTHGTRYTAPLADMPHHLTYLVERLKAAGGTLTTATITSLYDAAAHAPIVINCTGLGARELASDPTIYPIRGQHLIVTNPGLTDFTEADTGDSPDLIAIYPHGPHAVLGGTAQPELYDPNPDPTTAHAILNRCAEIEPRLHDATVLDHRVGHRPTRPTIRLEPEPLSGALIIHNYGHGGAGYTLAWGCAHQVADLVAVNS